MNRLFRKFGLLVIAVIASASFASCGDGDDEPEVPVAESNTVNIELLDGLWMEISYTELMTEAGGSTDKTTAFDGYTYKYARFEIQGDGTVLAEWISYPNMTVTSSRYYDLVDDKLYNGNTLIGTITKCVQKGSSSSDPSLVIVWEKSASPFNLGSKYRVRANYVRDTWSNK